MMQSLNFMVAMSLESTIIIALKAAALAVLWCFETMEKKQKELNYYCLSLLKFMCYFRLYWRNHFWYLKSKGVVAMRAFIGHHFQQGHCDSRCFVGWFVLA